MVAITGRSDATNSDLSLLETSADTSGIAPLVLSPSRPREGEKIVVIGNPLGLSGSVSDGIVAAHRALDGERLIQITAPISPGSSGSPVLNNLGQVVGVATLNVAGGQSLNFAIPSGQIVSLWEQHVTVASPSKSGTPTVSRPETVLNQSSAQQSIRLDGIFAGEHSAFTQYMRFYGDGTVTTINLTGSPDYKAGRELLANKKLDHLARGNYSIKDGKVTFVTKHKKQATFGHECTFAGVSLKCKIHNYSTDEDFIRVFQFATFSQLQ